jgi:hypothetical protein
MKKGFNSLWPTDLYLGSVNDTNLLDRVTQDIILSTDLDQPSSDFQSFDILSDGPSSLQEFRDTVVIPNFLDYLKHVNVKVNTDDIRVKSWITGTRNQYMIPIHNHSGASLSAVYYFICEEHDKGGELVLVDPRTNANRGYVDSFKPMFENKLYKPSSGEFVIFPSFLYHHTIPYLGKLRLAMPVDLFL